MDKKELLEKLGELLDDCQSIIGEIHHINRELYETLYKEVRTAERTVENELELLG